MQKHKPEGHFRSMSFYLLRRITQRYIQRRWITLPSPAAAPEQRRNDFITPAVCRCSPVAAVLCRFVEGGARARSRHYRMKKRFPLSYHFAARFKQQRANAACLRRYRINDPAVADLILSISRLHDGILARRRFLLDVLPIKAHHG